MCEVCWQNIDGEIAALQCGHEFCSECVFSYLLTKIEERNVMRIGCLRGDCGQAFNPADIELVCQQHGRPEIYHKFQYFWRSAEVERDPRLCWCPRPDCQGFAKRLGEGLREENIKCSDCAH